MNSTECIVCPSTDVVRYDVIHTATTARCTTMLMCRKHAGAFLLMATPQCVMHGSYVHSVITAPPQT